jgi:3-hydroxybutyryl-CoA dehydrogenase
VSQPAEKPGPTPDTGKAGEQQELLGVVGAGTIGCDLAATAAVHVERVWLWARSQQSAQRAREHVAGICAKLGREDAAARVDITQSLGDLVDATIVVEAVREDESIKRDVLRRLGQSLRPAAIVATTTSSLSVSDLAQACGRPARFFGMHVFNPVHRLRLVEICYPSQAQEETRERAGAFCEAIGKTVVVVPDEPGFVVNRLLFPYLFDAVRLLERTGLEPEEIDTCMKLGASHPMGPLELLDLVGIDVAEAIGEALYTDTGDAAHRPPGRIKKLVREGRLGRKAGAGFYTYRS